MATFVAQLATARKAASDARKALDTAHKHVEPPTAELHALFLTRPAQYAECLRKMADIVATLPALTAAAEQSAAALAALEERACWKCSGTGEYSAPTRAYRQGKPYCFTCNGTGDRTPDPAEAAIKWDALPSAQARRDARWVLGTGFGTPWTTGAFSTNREAQLIAAGVLVPVPGKPGAFTVGGKTRTHA